jgi:hypothetical protein
MVGRRIPYRAWFLWAAPITKKKKKEKTVAMAVGTWSSTTPSLPLKPTRFGRLGGLQIPRKGQDNVVQVGPIKASHLLLSYFSTFPNLGCKFDTNPNLPRRRKRRKGRGKKGGDGSRNVELCYAIDVSSKFCQASPLNLLGSGGCKDCKA